MSGTTFRKSFILILFGAVVLINFSCRKSDGIYLNENEFRDKVYACWLGKNIGGTLGMAFEGDTNVHNITFYTNLKEGEPAANDDLDLQILWLKAMQEHNGHVDAFTLGKYWLKYVPVNWNEYGVCKTNMNLGLMPPVSGEFNNSKWKTSNGAWIRSEIWACLFPGNPLMAAKFAREDACVDHGMAEGTYAEIFTASVESAAFIEPDRDKLIEFGLTMIPEECRVARAVRTAVRARNEGVSWTDARLAVIEETRDMGWFQAPRNVAFTIIGWLYGDNDFGKSISIAVNCGDDTDCTGATLGAIFGIIGGTKAIPEKWKKPIGNRIATVAISGFTPPATLDELTDSTVSMTKKVTLKYKLKLEVGPGKSAITKQSELLKVDETAVKKLWDYSPWRIARHNTDWVILFDYIREPIIENSVPRRVNFSVTNISTERDIYNTQIIGLPDGISLTGFPSDTFSVAQNAKRTFDFSVAGKRSENDSIMRMHFVLKRGMDTDSIPFTLVWK